MKNKTKKLATNFGLLFFTLFTFLILAEFGFRLVDEVPSVFFEKEDWKISDSYQISNNTQLVWELIPNENDINKYGMRDYEYDLNKPNNTIRIAVIGDSITFGAYVEKNETYESVLERSLNKKEKDINYEVLNFGVTGYNLKQYKEVLKSNVLKFSPDVVVVQFFINDIIYTPVAVKDEYNTAKLIISSQSLPLKHKSVFFLLRHSKLFRYSYLRFVEYSLIKNNKNIQLPEDFLNHRNNTLEDIQEINKISKENNIKLIFLVFPRLLEKEEYSYLSIHNEIINYTTSSNITTFDIYKIYNNNNNIKEFRTPYDYDHPNEKAHKIIGEALAVEIGKRIEE